MTNYDDLAFADATQTAALIKRKEISALEVVEAAIARAEELQPELNFLVTDTFDSARLQARNDSLDGPFAGVPYLVKDMYDVAGVPTRWGAMFGSLLPPATASCTQVDAMASAGLVIIGKSALGEMGYLPTTEPLASGPTRNPWDLDRSPGGSSGGSAAAVAAGVVPFADAADGGGSIRIPASACGLFGLKPSRDRLVGDQQAAAGYPLTTEHCLSRTVRDSAALFAALEAPNTMLPATGWVRGPSTRRLRVAVIADSLGGQRPEPDVAEAVEAAAALLDRLGHHVEETSYPFDTAPVMADFSVLYASSALGVRDLVASIAGAEPDETLLEPFTLAMAEVAAALPGGSLEEAKSRLSGVTASYEHGFERYDVIVSPVLLSAPILTGHIKGDVAFETILERLGAYVDYTVLHNVVGAPAMSVPLWWNGQGLPIGTQVAARLGDERTLFELAYELEEAQPWQHRLPPTRCGG